MVARLHDIPDAHTFPVRLPAHAAATATETLMLFRAPFACKVTAVRVVPDAAATGNDTNSTNLNLLNGGADGTGTTEIGNLDYATGTDAAVGVTQNIYAPSDPDDGVALAAGSVLKLQFEKVASGLALGAGLYIVEYRGN